MYARIILARTVECSVVCDFPCAEQGVKRSQGQVPWQVLQRSAVHGKLCNPLHSDLTERKYL